LRRKYRYVKKQRQRNVKTKRNKQKKLNLTAQIIENDKKKKMVEGRCDGKIRAGVINN